jgi:PAS domain S-box-containing protein
VTAEPVPRGTAGDAGFRLLAEHLPDIIILAFDHQLEIWAATGTALKARGWTAAQFLGRKVPEVGRPDDAAITEASCRAALRGEIRRFETNGNLEPTRLWAMQFVPLPGEQDAIIGGMVLARDITDHRLAERQLQASRRQLAEAQRIAQVGSWEWDLETDELTVSDELCRLFGLPLGIKLTMAQGVAESIHPADLERVTTSLRRLHDDPSPFELEHRIVRPDGDVWTVLARGEGMVGQDGRVVRFIGTDQDITDRRRADAERRRLLNRVYEAQEGQDRRLAADLHDGHVQSLAAIGFKLEQARLRLGASGSPRSTSCSGRSPRTCRPR